MYNSPQRNMESVLGSTVEHPRACFMSAVFRFPELAILSVGRRR